MQNAGIVLKVSPEEYSLLLSMRNAFVTVKSLREVLHHAICEHAPGGTIVEDLLEQAW